VLLKCHEEYGLAAVFRRKAEGNIPGSIAIKVATRNTQAGSGVGAPVRERTISATS
jgi:hypothetical protein